MVFGVHDHDLNLLADVEFDVATEFVQVIAWHDPIAFEANIDDHAVIVDSENDTGEDVAAFGLLEIEPLFEQGRKIGLAYG
ncbi:MAG: hypothetical protein Kow00120_14600 [Anaerolineae bacterium]